MVTPFLVTSRWLEVYLHELDLGLKETKARHEADRLCGICGKLFAHGALSSLTLTVPVEGGASTLKKPEAEPLLSDHGKWRREHLGAFAAVYGRTPYFQHLMPEIAEIYDGSHEITLEDFNSRLLQLAIKWIDPSIRNQMHGSLQKVRKETADRLNFDISIFDALFRLGKITGLAFIRL